MFEDLIKEGRFLKKTRKKLIDKKIEKILKRDKRKTQEDYGKESEYPIMKGDFKGSIGKATKIARKKAKKGGAREKMKKEEEKLKETRGKEEEIEKTYQPAFKRIKIDKQKI